MHPLGSFILGFYRLRSVVTPKRIAATGDGQG
jgi:hypothetical protein